MPDIKNKIKLIGIGAGNSSYEVEVFKKTYNVPFPLFPDKDFTIHKACGEVRTPYFMVVKINEDGTHQIVHTQLGNYPGAEPFLELVLKASGLKYRDFPQEDNHAKEKISQSHLDHWSSVSICLYPYGLWSFRCI